MQEQEETEIADDHDLHPPEDESSIYAPVQPSHMDYPVSTIQQQQQQQSLQHQQVQAPATSSPAQTSPPPTQIPQQHQQGMQLQHHPANGGVGSPQNQNSANVISLGPAPQPAGSSCATCNQSPPVANPDLCTKPQPSQTPTPSPSPSPLPGSALSSDNQETGENEG